MLKKIMLINAFLIGAYSASTEDFFYNRGYEMGLNAGYEQGVADAFKEAKNVIERYKAELKAYEIGKYLIKSQNLTYPQIWQEKTDDGKVVLRINSSRIEKELNVDELFSKFADIPQIPQINASKLELSLDAKNSVNLSSRDSNINEMVQKPNTSANKKTLNIVKNSKNLDILKKANVVFSDEDSYYNVLFFTNEEKQDFCKQFEICN